MPRYAAIVSYIGNHFKGWAKQPYAETIQLAVEESFQKVFNYPIPVTASGRTDTQVHAKGQVIHFDLQTAVDLFKTTLGVNAYLPTAIRLIRMIPVPDTFHAQKDAIKKQYQYSIQLGPVQIPQHQGTSLWIKQPLNLAAIQDACHYFIGTHDFLAFCAKKGSQKTTVRTIYDCKLIASQLYFEPFQLVQISVTGSGFLKQMVRSMVGTLLWIGIEKYPPEHVMRLLQNLDRSQIGPTVSGHGLSLEQVWYAQELQIPTFL
jgi:tRNA pseudouridine38-40 synthase